MFVPGDAVVCIDAADIPSPPWTPIQAGHAYVIRAVDPIPAQDGNYDKNIHKHARFQVRLWGVSNPIHPVFGIEMGYAETRFERIEPESEAVATKETMLEGARA
jgi:hypothetical protein